MSAGAGIHSRPDPSDNVPMAFAALTLADGRTVFLGVASVWQTGHDVDGELYSPGWMLRHDGPRGENWTQAITVGEVMELAPTHSALILEKSRALLRELRIQSRDHGLGRQRVYNELVADFEREIEVAIAALTGGAASPGSGAG
jgi:hypothetical protein